VLETTVWRTAPATVGGPYSQEGCRLLPFSGGRGDDALYGLAPSTMLPVTVANAAAVSSSTTDSNPANNSATVSVTVGAGRDRGDDIQGQAGDDKLYGSSGSDDLDGGDGSDSLFGEAGDDRLEAGAGNDALAGGRGRDILKGAGGNDSVDSRDGTRHTVDCGAGRRDEMIADARDVVRGCERVRRG
jgi:Ca2+-binding RTX toxin-like protein